MNFARTRIAPTPSGFLHIGNAFSFSLTAAIANKFNAKIFLRIDDMDRERVEAAYIQDIFDTLNFLRISWNEGPKNASEFEADFSQRHRLQLYESALQKLVATGKVYACDCSRKQIDIEHGGVYTGTCRQKNIPLHAPDVAWRIDTDNAGIIVVKGIDGQVERFDFPAEMNHFVIRKKDGFSAYQLTSLVDDLHFGVDLIVRGKDLFQSTLAQLFLARLLDADAFLQTAFFHHELLTDGDKRKLSKSAGDTSVRHFRECGTTATEIYQVISNRIGAPVRKWQDFTSLIP